MAHTLDEVIDGMGFGKFNLKIVLVIGMVWVMEGIEVTLISLVTPRLQCEWKLLPLLTALMTSTVFVGMGIGAMYWGWLGDKKGRKLMILISSVCVLYFAVLTSASGNFVFFMLIRFLVGVGVGGIASAICYLVEFSTTTHRARTVIACEFFFAFGNLFAAVISYLSMNALGWRAFVLLCAIPIPFTIFLIRRLPESVKYLQNTGDIDAIMKTLHSMSNENNALLPNDLTIECSETDDRGNIKTFLNTTYCKNLVVLIFLWIIAFWSYFGVVLLNTQLLQNNIYSAPARNTSTEECRLLSDADYLQNTYVVLGEFPGLVFFMLVIERLGRRRSLVLAFVGTSICFFVLAFPLSATTSSCIMFLARATSTVLPQILYILTLEIFPTTVRNTALGVCCVVGRMFLAGMPFLVDILVVDYHVVLVGFFSVATLLCSLLCLLLPETTGKALPNR